VMSQDNQALVGSAAELILAVTGIQCLVEKTTKGLEIRFKDIPKRAGPVFCLSKSGLKRHSLEVSFGNFSIELVNAIRSRDLECAGRATDFIQLAVSEPGVLLQFPGDLAGWLTSESLPTLVAERRDLDENSSIDAFLSSLESLVAPVVCGYAELIGYEPLSVLEIREEGELYETVTTRRERDPKNRLLCLRLRGNRCAVCGFSSVLNYGRDIDVIEVHHLEPLSTLDKARHFDPKVDLIPLCPNCHRAAHKRKPNPYAPDELRAMLLKNEQTDGP